MLNIVSDAKDALQKLIQGYTRFLKLSRLTNDNVHAPRPLELGL